MELLAPAGSVAAFEAALSEGADAVYVGSPGLNARALSRDFSFGDIAGMTSYAHEQGKKIYVAMNSLLKESEVPLALESLHQFAAIGPDALILQDLGLLYLARRYFPQIKVHASTLMTANTAMAATYFQQLGFERVVLARELSLAEIAAIHAQCGVELEIFIHGAMCFSYSGLCRFSSLHGGKSSLRGQCVQPCRRSYDWVSSGKKGRSSGGKKGGHLFSMNDLCGIENLAAVRKTGVVSLKIEGRLKSVAYVRNVVHAYRMVVDGLDASAEEQKRILKEAGRYLDQAMGRKRSSGFFISGQEARIIQPYLSGSSGEMVGKVAKVEQSRGRSPKQNTTRLQVSLQAPLSVGDRLRLYEEKSGARKSFTLRAMEFKGRRVERAGKGQQITILATDLDLNAQKGGHGLLFRVDLSARSEKQSQAVKRKIAALNEPKISQDTIARQLQELGITPQIYGTETKKRYRHGGSGNTRPSAAPQWWLKVSALEHARQRFPFQVSRVVLELNQANLERFFSLSSSRIESFPYQLVWALPQVMQEEQRAWQQQAIREVFERGSTGFQIGHIAQMGFFRELSHPHLEIFGDYSCNLLNSPALLQYQEAGLRGVQFSLETDRATLQEALTSRQGSPAGNNIDVGMYVYGRPPLFSARLDAPHFRGQRSFVSSRGERYYIDRQPEAVYAYAHMNFSLLAYNEELARMGVNYFVVDVSNGAAKRESMAVTALLHGRGDLPEVISGNYAGTLV
nr:peptidase U32 family protein [uncultured Desulfobulbus sp.]